METYFASARRTERRKLRNQIDDISKSPVMTSLLKTMGGLLVIINENRQLIAMNSAFLKVLGIDNPEDVLGLRLGESLRCIYAKNPPNGCGTTPHCRTCGAAIAMMSAIDDDTIDEQVCILTSEKEGKREELSLLVRAEPLIVEGKRWILIFAQDITQEQFWIGLERLFFHDISNTLSGLYGYAKLLSMEIPDHEMARKIHDITERLSQEIDLQKTLSYHKGSELNLKTKQITLESIKNELDLLIRQHPAAEGKTYEAHWDNLTFSFKTDPILLTRVLGNMLINAMEATPTGGLIRLNNRIDTSNMEWEIWNEGAIPKDLQLRIFQKHFSTKSALGRGLGTYAMKLFGESYLEGKVFFSSSEKEGTRFFFRLPLKKDQWEQQLP